MGLFDGKANRLISFAGCVFLVGCVSGGSEYRPIIDKQGVDFNKFERDLAECKSYSTETAGAGEGAMQGAVAGAVLGYAMSAIAGDKYDNSAGLRAGALAGATGGAIEGATNRTAIIQRCRAGRGYKVLQ